MTIDIKPDQTHIKSKAMVAGVIRFYFAVW